MILEKADSCNADSNNINSETCGNCNYAFGSTCKQTNSSSIKEGNYICQDLTCVDEEGKVRQNGESWCVYDGVIGNGSDVVGSRHWKRICNEGTVEVEPCADYRGQICVQSNVSNNEKTITQAQCVVNQAISCIQYNQDKNMKEECNETTQCLLKAINVDEGFKFNMCVPEYPKGFDLSYETGKDSAESLCGMANQECVVMYEKKISGWECIFNCNCEDKTFTEQMNNLCVSMGDCGSYVNIAGKGTDSYKIEENDNKVSWKDFSEKSNPIKGQYAEPNSLDESSSALVGNAEKYDNSSIGTEGLSNLNTQLHMPEQLVVLLQELLLLLLE
jgi:23S rRNA A1618 N6-methylase RlmF